jgi:hypothetical protein
MQLARSSNAGLAAGRSRRSAVRCEAKVVRPEGSPRVVRGTCFVTKDVSDCARWLALEAPADGQGLANQLRPPAARPLQLSSTCHCTAFSCRTSILTRSSPRST